MMIMGNSPDPQGSMWLRPGTSPSGFDERLRVSRPRYILEIRYQNESHVDVFDQVNGIGDK